MQTFSKIKQNNREREKEGEARVLTGVEVVQIVRLLAELNAGCSNTTNSNTKKKKHTHTHTHTIN